MTTSDRHAWRAHQCSLLSGEWRGSSLRPSGDINQPPIETVWTQTQLYFDPISGKVKGEGLSIYQNESYPFELLGAISSNYDAIELLKNHRLGTVVHLVGRVDLNTLTITAQFAHGGTCTLQRVNTNAAVASAAPYASHVQRSLSGGASSVGVGVPPLAEAAPRDLLTFLGICFADAPSIAVKLHQTLSENEIHDPESLTTLAPEEWKELGVPLGQRAKIKLQLQRFFPHLMKGQGGSSIGSDQEPNSATTISSSGGAASNLSPSPPLPLPSDPVYQPQYVSAPGSHYVSASQPPPAMFQPVASAASAASAYPPIHQQQQQSLVPPLEYLCPITRDLMDDPVIAADGHSYDRASISQWLTTKKTSPITNRILPSKALQPNEQLRLEIQQFKQRARM